MNYITYFGKWKDKATKARTYFLSSELTYKINLVENFALLLV